MGCNSVEAIWLHGGGCVGERGRREHSGEKCRVFVPEVRRAALAATKLVSTTSPPKSSRPGAKTQNLDKVVGQRWCLQGKFFHQKKLWMLFKWTQTSFDSTPEYGSSKALYFARSNLRLQKIEFRNFSCLPSRPSSLLCHGSDWKRCAVCARLTRWVNQRCHCRARSPVWISADASVNLCFVMWAFSICPANLSLSFLVLFFCFFEGLSAESSNAPSVYIPDFFFSTCSEALWPCWVRLQTSLKPHCSNAVDKVTGLNQTKETGYETESESWCVCMCLSVCAFLPETQTQPVPNLLTPIFVSVAHMLIYDNCVLYVIPMRIKKNTYTV